MYQVGQGQAAVAEQPLTENQQWADTKLNQLRENVKNALGLLLFGALNNAMDN